MTKALPLPLPFGEPQRRRIGIEASRAQLANRKGRLLGSAEDWTAAVALSTTPSERTKNDAVDVAAKVALWKEGLELVFDMPRERAVLLHAAAVLGGQGKADTAVAGRIEQLMAAAAARAAERTAKAEEVYGLVRPLLSEGLELLPHQREALVEIEERDYRLVVHDDLGLGKTVEVLTSLLLLTARGKLSFPVLIGCQTSMVGAWIEHVEKWLRRLGPTISESLEVGNVVVMPYGRLLDRWRECKAYNPRTVIFDESHYLKNPDTQRAKAAILASSGADHMLLTTATMDPNGRPEECYLQMKLCDRSIEWRDFRWRWCNAYRMTLGTRKVWNTKGSSNPVGFGKIMHRMSFRRTKADLGKDLGLPELSRFVIPVRFTARQLGELEGLKESVKESLRRKAEELRATGRKKDEVKADRVEESAVLAATTVVRKRTEEMKVPAAIQRTKELLDDGHRVVLFCFFPDNAVALHEALVDGAGKGRTVLLGTANLDAGQRTELVKEAEARADVLVLTYAYCEGITLVAFDRVLVVGRHWIPDKETQAEARVDRIGQTRPTAAEYLHGKGSIDEAMAEVAVVKETVARSIVGSTAVRVFEWLERGSVVGGRW